MIARCFGCEKPLRRAKAKGTPKTALLCADCDAIDKEIETRWLMYSQGFNDAAHADLMQEGR